MVRGLSDLSRSRRGYLGTVAALGVGSTLLAACRQQAPAPPGAPAAPQLKDVTVEYGQVWDPGQAPIVADWMERFNTKYAGQVKVVQGDQGDDNKVTTLAVANQLPDVIAVHHTRAQSRIRNEWIISLQPFIERDKAFDVKDFTPPSLVAYRRKGNLYGLPFDEGPKVLWYNLDMFDAAGLKYPDKDWTFTTMLDAAIRLTRGDGDNKIYGLASLPGAPFSPSQGVLVMPFGGKWVNETEDKTLLDARETVEGLQWWLDLMFRYRVVPTPEEARTISGNPFFAERAAMIITGTWTATQAKSVAKFRYDVAHYPRGPRQLVTGAEGSGLAISKDSKVPEAAWLWLSDFLSKEGQAEMFGKTGRGSPGRASAWTEFERSPVAMPSVKILLPILLDYAKHEQPIGPRTPDIQREAGPLWSEVLADTRSLNDYIGQAKRVAEPLLADNRIEL
jgi:multiple sugar transport system substrate-binding protein